MTKSILFGKDQQVLPILLELHCAVAHPRILDVTYNSGSMWKGLSYPLTTMDIDPSFGTDVVGDFTAMPFCDGSFDVIVFDPPHLPVAAASTHSSKMFEKRYGATATRERADHVGAFFAPFLAEAKRVLVPGGIVLAKIADIVHNHHYQWQHVLFINAVLAAEMTPCDCLIKADPNAGNLRSSKWKNGYHLRKAHCYWIVVRNSPSCEVRRAS
jgi:SAM-dependent methyltransferase